MSEEEAEGAIYWLKYSIAKKIVGHSKFAGKTAAYMADFFGVSRPVTQQIKKLDCSLIKLETLIRMAMSIGIDVDISVGSLGQKCKPITSCAGKHKLTINGDKKQFISKIELIGVRNVKC